jgi:hypothetical protein
MQEKCLQIGHLVFELSAFLYYSRWTTLKLTSKANEFRGHLFLEGRPYVAEQNKKVNLKWTLLFRVIHIPQIVAYRQTFTSTTIHAKCLLVTFCDKNASFIELKWVTSASDDFPFQTNLFLPLLNTFEPFQLLSCWRKCLAKLNSTNLYAAPPSLFQDSRW